MLQSACHNSEQPSASKPSSNAQQKLFITTWQRQRSTKTISAHLSTVNQSASRISPLSISQQLWSDAMSLHSGVSIAFSSVIWVVADSCHAIRAREDKVNVVVDLYAWVRDLIDSRRSRWSVSRIRRCLTKVELLSGVREVRVWRWSRVSSTGDSGVVSRLLIKVRAKQGLRRVKESRRTGW